MTHKKISIPSANLTGRFYTLDSEYISISNIVFLNKEPLDRSKIDISMSSETEVSQYCKIYLLLCSEVVGVLIKVARLKVRVDPYKVVIGNFYNEKCNLFTESAGGVLVFKGESLVLIIPEKLQHEFVISV